MKEIEQALEKCKDVYNEASEELKELNNHWFEFIARLYPIKPVHFTIHPKPDSSVSGAILKKSGSWMICVRIKDEYIRLVDSPILTRLEWLDYQTAIAMIVFESNMSVLQTLQNTKTCPAQITDYKIVEEPCTK